MDTDLEQMSREQLVEEVRKLRHGIREHRDSNLHELCWHHPALWGLLPEKTDLLPEVPDWPVGAQHAPPFQEPRHNTVSFGCRKHCGRIQADVEEQPVTST
jgi:hypothetical protein